MAIVKYRILNPITDHKKPYYDYKRKQFIFPVQTKYNYFLEAVQFNPTTNDNDYFILVGKDKFDYNCRSCETDMYGKCKIRVIGALRDYILDQLEDRGNLKVEYIESGENYDVFSVV